MTTEKPELVQPSPKKPKFEQLRADHELFLRAFEKPTQIYRFLRTRNAVQPVFLHRTLSYMRHRRTPNTAKRKFKLDEMLGKALEKQRKEEGNEAGVMNGFMNLTFTGFFHGPGPVNGDISGSKKGHLVKEDFIGVDVFLVKICHRRRSDNDNQVVQVPLGQGSAPYNPRSQLLPPSPAASVSVENSAFSNGRTLKTCILTLEVRVPFHAASKPGKRGRRRRSQFNGVASPCDIVPLQNGTVPKMNAEPPPKRRRLLRGAHDVEGEDSDTSIASSMSDVEHRVYTAELIVFDNNRHCLLTDGEYELALQEKYKKPGRKKAGLLSSRTSWEAVFDGQVGPFDVFAYGPTLKFRLSWTGTPVAPLPTRLSSSLSLPTQPLDHSVTNGTQDRSEDSASDSSKKKQRVFYQFIYNNNTRQQTEAREDFFCPWCSIDCKRLYSLLKHLKLCHGRFVFVYAPHNKGAKIDVCVNENYDAVLPGKCDDISSLVGFACSRDGPSRCIPATQVTVWRPQRRKESLSEFLQPDFGDVEGSRPFYDGYNRVYFQSSTCLPIAPQMLDRDSEEETDPEWMKTKTTVMIDEFTDVNDGEKELMKLWNLHMMKKGYIADLQLSDACREFVEEHGKELQEKRLTRNFLLHLVNLHDFNLIHAGHIQEFTKRLHVMA